MINVTGIGGIFFRSKEPLALSAWYERNLGISGIFRQLAGPTVFEPFPETTTYFPADRQWMINFRVESLDDAVAHLREAGVRVETKPDEWDSPATGKFARLFDPEGNAIELWEPATPPSSVPPVPPPRAPSA
jgi:catechol 2,3-dioxygenase-like lactoylglutathione lyase family enzyme